MLYSALQKNFDRDLSRFEFSFEENLWRISAENQTFPARNIEECVRFLREI
jgi:iron complex transport system ATP-binding protein